MTITLFLSSRNANNTINGSNANITYTTNLSAYLDPTVKEWECELTFLSELYQGSLTDVGLIGINFAVPDIINGLSKQVIVAKIFPTYPYNGVNYYTMYQATTQDNSKFTLTYPYSTNSCTITLTNYSGAVLGGGNMPHYNLVMTFKPIANK